MANLIFLGIALVIGGLGIFIAASFLKFRFNGDRTYAIIAFTAILFILSTIFTISLITAS